MKEKELELGLDNIDEKLIELNTFLDAIDSQEYYILGEVLADSIKYEEGELDSFEEEEIEGLRLKIKLEKIN